MTIRAARAERHVASEVRGRRCGFQEPDNEVPSPLTACALLLIRSSIVNRWAVPTYLDTCVASAARSMRGFSDRHSAHPDGVEMLRGEGGDAVRRNEAFL